LGYRPEEIRYVIHSHGHFDHFGGGDRLRKDYGCKILMSAVDTALLREMPERALLNLAPGKDDEICWPDETIEDGDVITLGNTAIRCILAPGHTPGTMAFFFDATDGMVSHPVGYWGGVGFLGIYKEFLAKYKLPENTCQILKESIEKLSCEKVDILLGNHPNHNCLVEKREYMLRNPGTNPFLNPDSWTVFLHSLEARRQDFERLGY